jgi:hypothetical protein
LAHVEHVHVTLKLAHEEKLHAADLDATLLRSQLQPHCTPTLRRALEEAFGERTDPDEVERDQVMAKLRS